MWLNRLRAWQGELALCALLAVKILCKAPGLRQRYRRLLVRLLKRTGLFDADYYLTSNADVAQQQIAPLHHYASYGDREGRQPMPLFCPSFYRSQIIGSRLARVNALLHYCRVGRYRCLSPSPWFDLPFYLANNKDVARAGIDPLLHYLRWGGREGRSPSEQFDGNYYLRENPDVAASALNPLIHYLFYGRSEGRKIRSYAGEDSAVPLSERPAPGLIDDRCWVELAPRAACSAALVDVVVPVYKGRAETLRCLYSVLVAPCVTPFELVVINDASPDEDLCADLRRLASAGHFTLRENPANRGFVQTVNAGMQLHPERDVVILNADTEVFHNWLDRLRQAAYRHPRTGTVTPLSNNATICSYPRTLHDNPYPLELAYADLDALASRVNADAEVEAPTAVGFCTYLKRTCLAEVGLFDAGRFGRGYGEENDFSQRAIRRGWRNVIAADTFVHHWGSASFQGEKAKLVANALKTLDRLHPGYRSDVDDFIRRDPLAEFRQRLDRERLLLQRRAKNVLIVTHNRGGGTERHVQEDIDLLQRSGYGVYLLRPLAKDPLRAVLSHPNLKLLPNLAPFVVSDAERLLRQLRELAIGEIQTHSLVDFAPATPDLLVALARDLGARLEVNLHDYKVICPRINLIDGSGAYCGEPPPEGCHRCLVEHGSDFRVTDIGAWRAMHERALRAADRILVPDQDVAERLGRYFPHVDFEVSPHEEIDLAAIDFTLPVLAEGERLRVVVIGAIGRIKGYDILLACAREARNRRLPLDFIVMGYSMNDAQLQAEGVTVTGRYQEGQALETLRDLAPHAVWLPSVWPETYSYTLSLALQAGLPVVAFDLGAIAARLRRIGRADYLVPCKSIFKATESLDVFLGMRNFFAQKHKRT